MRVVEPKVKRRDRTLDEVSAHDQRKTGQHQTVRRRLREHLPELRQIERIGAAVNERDSEQNDESGDRVRDGKIDRAFDRFGFFDLVCGQRNGRRGHQFEPDEHVEDVAGERVAAHRGQKCQEQRVKQRSDDIECLPGVHGRHEDQQCDETSQAGADRIDGEADPDCQAVMRRPAAHPVNDRSALRGVERKRGAHSDDGERSNRCDRARQEARHGF